MQLACHQHRHPTRPAGAHQRGAGDGNWATGSPPRPGGARLGREAEANKARELARLLPLANESERAQLAQGLLERKLTSEALAQWQLVSRYGTMWEWGMGNALQNANRSDAGAECIKPFLMRRELHALTGDALLGVFNGAAELMRMRNNQRSERQPPRLSPHESVS